MLKFKRTTAISLPLFNLSANKDGSAKSHYIRVEQDFVEHQSDKETASPDMMRSILTDLESGEQFSIYMHKGLASKFKVGQAYEVSTRKEQGRRYPDHSIYEIEIEAPAKSKTV